MKTKPYLLLAWASMAAPMSAQTQTDTIDCDHMQHLQEVVVTGLTGQTRMNQLPAPMLVIGPAAASRDVVRTLSRGSRAQATDPSSTTKRLRVKKVVRRITSR